VSVDEETLADGIVKKFPDQIVLVDLW